MKVQLLFACHEIRRTSGDLHGARLGAQYPVQGHPLEEEMKSFWKYTPAGTLDFQSINERAVSMFEPGKLYRITIEPAEE